MTFRLGFIIFLLVSASALTWLFFPERGWTLESMDSTLSALETSHHAQEIGSKVLWNSSYWLGQPVGTRPLNPLYLYSFLPSEWVNSLIHILGNVVFGMGVFLLCRSLKLHPVACLFGAFATAFSSHNLTMAFPGHVKVHTMACIPFVCLCFLKWLDTKKLFFLIFSGISLGLSLQGGEGPVAYFMGIWLVVWSFIFLFFMPNSELKEGSSFGTGLLFFALGKISSLKTTINEGLSVGPDFIRKFLKECFRLGSGLSVIVALVLLVGAQLVLSNWLQITTLKPITGGEDTEANWHYATQYFFPPEETLSYVTTVQFFGGPFGRNREPTYWGRDGSPQPLRLTDDYMGLLPFGFAILGGIVCWRIWQAQLFVIMGLGSLLASFGRDGGLFWILYQLPTMKAHRNPHRWTFFVAFATCILAAYGVDWFLRKMEELKTSREENHPDKKKLSKQSSTENSSSLKELGPWPSILFTTTFFGCVLALVSWMFSSNPQSGANLFYKSEILSSPQGPIFIERARMAFAALTHTGIFLSLSAGTLYWMIRIYTDRSFHLKERGLVLILSWVFLFFTLILDLGTNAKRYISFYNWQDLYFKNPIAELLKKETEPFRVKALNVQQNPYLSNLVSAILPFHQIPVVDPPAVSRLATDYSKLFGYMDGKWHFTSSKRQFDFFNVKYILSPNPLIGESETDLILAGQWNGIHVYKRSNYMPRAWIASSAKVILGNDDEVLFQTLHPGLNWHETVVLEEKPIHLETKPSTEFSKQPFKSSSRTVRYLFSEDASCEMEVMTDKPSLLVTSEKYDPDWKAWVDGVPAKIYKTNFLMRGVEIPSGKHTVRMEYRPSTIPFYISAISMGISLTLGIVYGFYRWRKRV